MWLKNWSYWLKGGITALFFELITIIIAFVNGYLKIRVAECLIPPCPITYQFYNLKFLDLKQFILFLLLATIVIFLIGAIIGFIVRKIKKK